MPPTVNSNGNTLNLPLSASSWSDGNRPTIAMKGTRNVIEIGEGSTFNGFAINMRGTRNKLIIENGCTLAGGVSIRGEGSTVLIQKGTTFQHVKLMANEGKSIEIGQDCMLSKRIELRTSDSHAIYDRETKERLNQAGSIKIGDHVWIGMEVVVSKGVSIASGCVLGAKSFVNRSFDEPNCIIAGIPARIIRKNIHWERSFDPELVKNIEFPPTPELQSQDVQPLPDPADDGDLDENALPPRLIFHT